MSDLPRSRTGTVIVAVAALAGAVGALAGVGIDRLAGGRPDTPARAAAGSDVSVVNGGRTDVQTTVARALPGVVTVRAVVPLAGGAGPFSGAGETVESEGTGMLVGAGGEVLTADDVVAGATAVTVTLDGSARALPARVVGSDPGHDLALLQVAGLSGLRTVAFAASGPAAGAPVVVVGDALGLPGRPVSTSGTVSATDRPVTTRDADTGRPRTVGGMVQIDAAINPGASGGPVLDATGRVVAMSTAVAMADGNGSPNVAFAVPVTTITALLPQLHQGVATGSLT